MPKPADAIIIGTGILGASTAYYLSQGGIKNIVIIDALVVGGQATRATAAMVMHQTGVGTTTQLSKIALEKYAHFYDEVGIDIDFQRSGSVLFTATLVGQEALKKLYSMQNKLGILTQVWDWTTIEQKMHGFMKIQEHSYGNYCPSDGYINAQLAVRGYLDRAKEKGATVLENTRATQIIMQNRKIEGVETDKGERIYASMVVNCAGVWANDIAQSIGITIPIKANKKCLGIIENHYPSSALPIFDDYDNGWYFRPHTNGIMVGFGAGEWIENGKREESPQFDSRKVEDLKEYAMHRAPKLLPINLIDGGAGYRPMIDPQLGDKLPIIGPVKGITGYFNNCGYGEFGISHAAAGGELLAQIVLGQKTSMDANAFSFSRFSIDH